VGRVELGLGKTRHFQAGISCRNEKWFLVWIFVKMPSVPVAAWCLFRVMGRFIVPKPRPGLVIHEFKRFRHHRESAG
jgi:hypothetical protein